VANKLSFTPISDPKAFVLHNIAAWRKAGYSDDTIGFSMIQPALKTKEQFEAYGLAWVDRDVPNMDRADVQALKQVLNRCIKQVQDTGKPIIQNAEMLEAGLSIHRVNALLDKYPDLKELRQELSRLNKTASIRRRGRLILDEHKRALRDASDWADAQIASGHVPLLYEVCAHVDRCPTWITSACLRGVPEAIKLRDRIMAAKRRVSA
jgi:hypothetical protein